MALEIHVDLDVSKLSSKPLSRFPLAMESQALFWTDGWCLGTSIDCQAPNIVRIVLTRFRKSRTVIAHALHEQRWLQDITGVLFRVLSMISFLAVEY